MAHLFYIRKAAKRVEANHETEPQAYHLKPATLTCNKATWKWWHLEKTVWQITTIDIEVDTHVLFHTLDTCCYEGVEPSQ